MCTLYVQWLNTLYNMITYGAAPTVTTCTALLYRADRVGKKYSKIVQCDYITVVEWESVIVLHSTLR